MEETPYERYKIVLSNEEFYKTWAKEDLSNLTPELSDKIYKRYVVKCAVFQRDDFRCQNEECKYCKNEQYEKLTIHHIKFQRNGGADKARNCITICASAHKHFHRKKDSLTFNGMTYMEHKESEIDWKAIKAEGKKIRKGNLQEHGIHISWQMMAMLMRFLSINYEDFSDDESS